MWCSRGCLEPHAISDAWLCHVSIAGGSRRRGCAAAGVSVFLDGPLLSGLCIEPAHRAPPSSWLPFVGAKRASPDAAGADVLATPVAVVRLVPHHAGARGGGDSGEAGGAA